MNRRNFLGSLIGGVAAGAAVRTWPFRIFSFPPEITAPVLSVRDVNKFEYECDFVNGTAVRYEASLRNGVWVPLSESVIEVGTVDWQRSATRNEDRQNLIALYGPRDVDGLIEIAPSGN